MGGCNGERAELASRYALLQGAGFLQHCGGGGLPSLPLRCPLQPPIPLPVSASRRGGQSGVQSFRRQPQRSGHSAATEAVEGGPCARHAASAALAGLLVHARNCGGLVWKPIWLVWGKTHMFFHVLSLPLFLGGTGCFFSGGPLPAGALACDPAMEAFFRASAPTPVAARQRSFLGSRRTLH
jgi:hypothetical protein